MAAARRRGNRRPVAACVAVLLLAVSTVLCSPVSAQIYNWDTDVAPDYQGGNGKWSDRTWCADDNTRTGTALGPWVNGKDAIFRNLDVRSYVDLDVDVFANSLRGCYVGIEWRNQGPHGPGTVWRQTTTRFETVNQMELGNAELAFKMDAPYGGQSCDWIISGGQLRVGTDLVVSRYNYGNLFVLGGSIQVGGNFYATSPGPGDWQTQATTNMTGGTFRVNGSMVVGPGDVNGNGPFPFSVVEINAGTLSIGKKLVITPAYLGGWSFAGGGQSLTTITFVQNGGSIVVGDTCAPGDVTCGLTVMAGYSYAFAQVPEIDFYGGTFVVAGGRVAINDWAGSTEPAHQSVGLVTFWGGMFRTAAAVDFVLGARTSATAPKSRVYVRSGARVQIGGALVHAGGDGYLELRGGILQMSGLQISGGSVTVLLASGTVQPVTGPVLVTGGNMAVNGRLSVYYGAGITFNVPSGQTGMFLQGTDVVVKPPGIVSDPNNAGVSVFYLVGANMVLAGTSIGPISSLVLSGTLHGARTVQAPITVRGASGIAPDDTSTNITAPIVRTAAASLVVTLDPARPGRLTLAGMPAGIISWAVVRTLLNPPAVDFLSVATDGKVSAYSPYVRSLPSSNGNTVFFADRSLAVPATATIKALGLKLAAGVVLSGGAGAAISFCTVPGSAVVLIILMGKNNVTVPRLNFGACEVLVYTEGVATITSTLTGTGGLVKFGPGSLAITSSLAQFTGTVSVNGGRLTGAMISGRPMALPGGSGGRFSLMGQNLTVPALDLGDADTGVIENGGAGLSVLTAGILLDSTYTGTIQDGGTGRLQFVKTGPGALTLQGATTLTGGLYVQGGSILAASLPDIRLGVGKGGKIAFTDLPRKTFSKGVDVLSGGGMIELPDGSAGMDLGGPVLGVGHAKFRGGDIVVKKGAYVDVGGFTLGTDGIGGSMKFQANTTLKVMRSRGTQPFNIAYNTDGTMYTATLDLSETDLFECDVSEINLAIGQYQVPLQAVVHLARNNNIRVRGDSGIVIAAWGTTMNVWQTPTYLIFGLGTSNVRTPVMKVGTSQGVAQVQVENPGTVTVTSVTGAVINLNNGPGVGSNLVISEGNYNSNRFTLATLDLTRATFNALLNEWVICDAQGSAGEKWPIIYANFMMNKGVINVRTIRIGRTSGNGRCRAYALFGPGSVVNVGTGGFILDSNALTSSCQQIDINGGQIHLVGGEGADFVIGPNSMAKCDNQLSLWGSGTLLNFAGRWFRFRDPTWRKILVRFQDGAEIRDPGYWEWDVPLNVQGGFINVSSVYRCDWLGVLTMEYGSVLVGEKAWMVTPQVNAWNAYAPFTVNGLLQAGSDWFDCRIQTLQGTGRVLKVGAKSLSIPVMNFQGDIEIKQGSAWLRGLGGPQQGRNALVRAGTKLETSGTWTGTITVEAGASLVISCSDSEPRTFSIGRLILLNGSSFAVCMREQRYYVGTLEIRGQVTVTAWSDWVLDNSYNFLQYNQLIGDPVKQFVKGWFYMAGRTWTTLTNDPVNKWLTYSLARSNKRSKKQKNPTRTVWTNPKAGGKRTVPPPVVPKTEEPDLTKIQTIGTHGLTSRLFLGDAP